MPAHLVGVPAAAEHVVVPAGGEGVAGSLVREVGQPAAGPRTWTFPSTV